MATSPVASRTNSLDTRRNPTATRLILMVGSRAGREALLQYGYYMIGRHSECQIRPKSRSVSRRHCLLFQDESGVKVFDLESTSGTRVNDRRIYPKTWTLLGHGDMLRCGKVVFRVDLGGADANPSSELPESPDCEPSDSMSVGQAWHDVDIAGFLEGQDDADRKRRYEAIRGGTNAGADQLDASVEDLQTTIEMDVDLDLFEDAFDDPDPSEIPTTSDPTPQAEELARDRGGSSNVSAGSGSIGDAAAEAGRASKQASNRTVPRSLGRAPRQRSIKVTFEPERWKPMGIGLVLLLALGALGYSAYRFYAGPSVRVLNNID